MPACADRRTHRSRPWAAGLWIALVLLGVSACEGRRQADAEHALAEIEAVLTDAGTGPSKYIPGELADVRAGVDELQRDYLAGRYREVLARAPEVLAAARALAPAAAARAAELDRTLRAEWTTLSAVVPAELAAVADRFDRLAARRNLPAGVTRDDVQAAKGRLRDALALWDRAREEADAGRLPEAVTLAAQIRAMGRSVDALSAPADAAGAPVE
jgi:hypothetical protein